MNYMPIHTNIYPSYNYLAAENAYLKQSIEYKDAVLADQQTSIGKFRADVDQLSQANMQFRTENDKLKADADRWRIMKKIILTQGGEQQLNEVQSIVEKERQK